MNTRRTFFRSRAARRAIAFTLVELLVIVVIIGVMIGAGVPAIRNMIYTSTGTMAETKLRFGLSAARDLAIRSASGDSAAVFTFEPGGRLSIIPMVWVGQVLDTTNPDVALSATAAAYRDVFAPSALAEPVQLPAGWMVRGFAPPGAIFAPGANNATPSTTVQSNGWYFESPASAKGNRKINLGPDTISGSPNNKGNWVFPETGFYDPTVTGQGNGGRANSRSTFMIRFQSGTGRIVGASVLPVLVLLPRPTIDTTTGSPLPNLTSPGWSGPSDWRRIDHADNLPNWAKAVCKLPDPSDAAALIGCRSTDVALACGVSLIALYDEARMVQSLGAKGLNKVTGSIYGPLASQAPSDVPNAPNIDLTLWPASSKVAGNAEYVQMLINSYMLNALKYSDVETGGPNTTMDADGRIFRVDTYFGSVVETR